MRLPRCTRRNRLFIRLQSHRMKPEFQSGSGYLESEFRIRSGFSRATILVSNLVSTLPRCFRKPLSGSNSRLEARVGIGPFTPRFEGIFSGFWPFFNLCLLMRAYARICRLLAIPLAVEPILFKTSLSSAPKKFFADNARASRERNASAHEGARQWTGPSG